MNGAGELRLPASVLRLRRPALIAGGGAALLCLLGALFDAALFHRAWLVGVVLWTGVALGCLAVLLLHHLTGGVWGLLARRLLEAGARTLPALALLFVPLLFGLPALYAWARPEELAGDEHALHKLAWLNPAGYVLRTLLAFVLWSALAFWLAALSRAQDAGRPTARRMRLLAAPALALHTLLATMVAIDWLMSLDITWASSGYGLLFVAGNLLSAGAFVVLALVLVFGAPELGAGVRPGLLHDWGNLLLTFVLLWAYLSFTQFLIVWSGDLPEEVGYYLDRSRGGWPVVAALLALLHFAVPFLLLLSRDWKRKGARLLKVAVLLLVLRWVDVLWLVVPSVHHGAAGVGWLDPLAVLAVGGLWFAAFLTQLERAPLLPLRAPGVEEVLQRG